MGIGMSEIMLIAMFVLVFFGANKIPEFMRSVGKGVREFKDVMSDVKKEVDSVQKDIPRIDVKL